MPDGELTRDLIGPVQRNSLRVLVVDDEEHLAKMFRNALSEEGYVCEFVTASDQALEKMRNGNFDIMVSDVLMPRMGGIQLVKKVLEIDPRVKFMLITGVADVNTAIEAMKTGASDFLSKPFDLVEFTRRVDRIAQEILESSFHTGMKDGSSALEAPTFPGYVITEKIGSGAMGSVFKGRQVALNRVVALKVISSDKFKESRAQRRFMREARAAARMNHPNLIQVYDLIRHDKFWFIVMEYFPSRSLLDVVEQSGALEFGKAVKVIRQVTAALLHANEMNIVHRDVKPGNILIGRDWVAKLSDFGLAKSRTIVSEDEADGRVTRVGAIVGTPAYISPEQVLAVSDIDVRSDIYCLGLCFHYMLEGKHPFVGEVSELLAMQIKTPVPELTVPGVPEAAKAIIRKMAHKDREKRFSDPGRLLSALGEL